MSILRCPCCGTVANWQQVQATKYRQNSRTTVIECQNCHCQIHLKQLLATLSNSISEAIEQEYNDIQTLADIFPASSVFGTLRAVALNKEEGILATCYIPGETLEQALHNAPHEAIPLLTKCGQWLKLFHHTSKPVIVHSDSLEKLAYIESLWDIPRVPGLIKATLPCFSEAARQLGHESDTGYLIHGDFTPDNIRVGNGKITAVDINRRLRNTPDSDLAPFLNHLAFFVRSPRGLKYYRRLDSLETAFLRGYSDIPLNEMRLTWYRLYYLLSYWGNASQSSLLRRHYARLQFSGPIAVQANKLKKLLAH